MTGDPGLAWLPRPPHLGWGWGEACQNPRRVLLGGDPLKGTPRREPSVSSQTGVPVAGHGSISRICEEGLIGEGGLWGKPSPWPVRGHRVDGLYPQHPRLSALLGPKRRSLGWEVTGERALRGLRKAIQRSAGCSFDGLERRVRKVEGLWQVPSARPGPRSSQRPAVAPLPPLPPPQ